MMIRLNYFQRYDTTNLENYLHDEALNGNHVHYVSSLFLIFKKEAPAKRYYKVLPRPWKSLNTDLKEVATPIDYTVYKSDEPIKLEIEKQNKHIFRTNFEKIAFLLNLAIIVICVPRSTFLSSAFFSSTKVLWMCISILLLPAVLYYTLLQKQGMKLKSIRYHPYLHYLFLLVIICLLAVISFGDVLRSTIFILGCLLFLFMPFKEIVFWILFMGVGVLALAWVTPQLPATVKIESYTPVTFDYKRQEYDQTGLMSYENYDVSARSDETYQSIEYFHYQAKVNWMLKITKRDPTLEFRIEVITSSEKIDDNDFDKAYQLKKENSYSYYFEYKNQILIVYQNMEDVDVIEFAKDKMKIERN